MDWTQWEKTENALLIYHAISLDRGDKEMPVTSAVRPRPRSVYRRLAAAPLCPPPRPVARVV